jgi:hypothetical protein
VSATRSILGWRLVYAAVAFLLATASSHLIFQRVPTGSDENSYVFQAYNFRDGHIARPAPPIPEAFAQEMIVINRQAGWFSRYPPGHPLWLLPGIFFDAIYPMIALAAAVAMWFLCGAATALRISQAMVALPLLASPFFFFMFGTQLSHTSGLAASAALCWGYLRAHTRNERWPLAIAGLAWSLLFLNRTYTALLMAIPFGLDAVIAWLRARNMRSFHQMALFAGTAACGVLAYLAYNKLATGDAFLPTYLFYEPSENLGFGPRRTQGMEILHTPERGLSILLTNVVDLDQWLFGLGGSLVLATAFALYGWHRRWSPVLLGSMLCVWAGYVAFWFHGVEEAGGPVYYFETLAPLFLAFALGVSRLWQLHHGKPLARKAVACALVAALFAGSAAFIRREGRLRAEVQQIKRNLYDTIATLPTNALVFLEKFEQPHMGGIVFNPRGRESNPLLMRSMYEDNPVAQRLFPDRPAFVIRGSSPHLPEPLEPPERLHVSREARKFHRRTGANKVADDGRVIRVATEGDKPDWLAFGLSLNLPAGRWRVVWAGRTENVQGDAPLKLDITMDKGQLSLAEASVSGTHPEEVHAFEIALTNVVSRVEARVRYGGSGTVELEALRVDEVR